MEHLVFLAALSLSAAAMFIGAISGGVGLILRPALIFLGIPAHIVVGTAKVGGAAGELPGLFILGKHERIDWRLGALLVIPMMIGAAGAALVTLITFQEHLELFIGVLLLIVGVSLLIRREFGVSESGGIRSPVLKHAVGVLGTAAVSFIGIFTGGVGPLYTWFYMTVYGKTYTQAAALWRFAGYVGFAPAFVIFIVGGAVDWWLALGLAIGLGIGSYFGTHYGLRQGERWVRATVIGVVLISSAVLIL